ncbi:hypothetical protein BX666DRAFT_1500351 [Dichotomocladium elegans]|nr:hypothetical protein BX666DRAFT_1500351 [Dichotomocladium elegans]
MASRIEFTVTSIICMPMILSSGSQPRKRRAKKDGRRQKKSRLIYHFGLTKPTTKVIVPIEIKWIQKLGSQFLCSSFSPFSTQLHFPFLFPFLVVPAQWTFPNCVVLHLKLCLWILEYLTSVLSKTPPSSSPEFLPPLTTTTTLINAAPSTTNENDPSPSPPPPPSLLLLPQRLSEAIATCTSLYQDIQQLRLDSPDPSPLDDIASDSPGAKLDRDVTLAIRLRLPSGAGVQMQSSETAPPRTLLNAEQESHPIALCTEDQPESFMAFVAQPP